MPKDILEKAICLIKNLTKFVLQLCAVMSQLNEHEKALEYSKKASYLAKDLTNLTLVAINNELGSKKSLDVDCGGNNF